MSHFEARPGTVRRGRQVPPTPSAGLFLDTPKLKPGGGAQSFSQRRSPIPVPNRTADQRDTSAATVHVSRILPGQIGYQLRDTPSAAGPAASSSPPTSGPYASGRVDYLAQIDIDAPLPASVKSGIPIPIATTLTRRLPPPRERDNVDAALLPKGGGMAPPASTTASTSTSASASAPARKCRQGEPRASPPRRAPLRRHAEQHQWQQQLPQGGHVVRGITALDDGAAGYIDQKDGSASRRPLSSNQRWTPPPEPAVKTEQHESLHHEMNYYYNDPTASSSTWRPTSVVTAANVDRGVRSGRERYSAPATLQGELRPGQVLPTSSVAYCHRMSGYVSPPMTTIVHPAGPSTYRVPAPIKAVPNANRYPEISTSLIPMYCEVATAPLPPQRPSGPRTKVTHGPAGASAPKSTFGPAPAVSAPAPRMRQDRHSMQTKSTDDVALGVSSTTRPISLPASFAPTPVHAPALAPAPAPALVSPLPIAPSRSPSTASTASLSRRPAVARQSRTTSSHRGASATSSYSAGSNKSYRASLYSTITNTPPSPSSSSSSADILPSGDRRVYASPPESDFTTFSDGARSAFRASSPPAYSTLSGQAESETLQWEADPEESSEADEAQAVWRRMEARMGRRLNSGLEEERGRWVLRKSTRPVAARGVDEVADMSPGQFSVSEYMSFGEAGASASHPAGSEDGFGSAEAYGGCEFEEEDWDNDTAPPKFNHSALRQSMRAEVHGSSSPGALDELLLAVDSYDTDAPQLEAEEEETVSPGLGLRLAREKTRKRERTSVIRLDTQIVHALQALKADWDSPELDAVLGLGRTEGPLPSASTEYAGGASSGACTPVRDTGVASRGLLGEVDMGRLSFLHSRSDRRVSAVSTSRSVSPASPRLTTPSPRSTPLPAPPASQETGLGLGMHIGTQTTYGLPSTQKADQRRERGENEGGGVFVIRCLDTGEARAVGIDSWEAELGRMARS